MIKIDYTSSKAIYEQIYDEVTKLILSKALKPDEKLASVRELASMININPNTIQKAYKHLELNDYVYPVKGKGYFVKNTDDLMSSHLKKMNEDLSQTVKSLIEVGLSNDDVYELVKNILSKILVREIRDSKV